MEGQGEEGREERRYGERVSRYYYNAISFSSSKRNN